MDEDRDVIVETLQRVRNRVHFNRALREFGFVCFLFLASVLAFQLIRLFISIPAGVDTYLPKIWLVAFSVFFVWRVTRKRTLAQAAAIADGEGDLKDELKTAYWFIKNDTEDGEKDASPWIELQTRRAATTAADLDLGQLVPTIVPKGMFLADGILFAIGIFLWTLTGQPSMVSPYGALELTGEEENKVQDIRELLADAGQTETVQELDETLVRLEQGELSLADGLQDLAIVENLLSEGNLELSTIKEGLGELAQNLRTSSELTPVADAIQSSDLDDASDLLRALAENLPEAPADMAALREALEKASQTEDASLEELLENLRQAAEALARQDSDEFQRSLEEAANELESMGRKMEAQKQMNDARRQLGELRQSLGQSPFGAPDEQAPPPADTSDAGDGEAAPAEAGGMAMPGGDVQLQLGGGAAPDPTDVLDAGPGGHSTGPSQGEDNIPGEPTRLEVQLEMEMLAAEEDPERTLPDDIFDKESRQEHSLVDYQQASPRADYSDEAVMNEERIPWRYRNLVKSYFLALNSQQAQQAQQARPEDNN